MKLVDELRQRGLIYDSSADPEKIFAEQRTVYIGSDPTADSLHVGHLAWIVLMKRLVLGGHKPVLLVGGGTGMIGDPKEKGERVLLSEDIIDQNAEAIRLQLDSMLGAESGLVMVNNAEWLREVKLIPFLRDVGKHFTVNELIKRDLIKRRLDNPDDSISYTEFTYSLLQAYDYWELNRRYGVDLQLGGSDQWTNVLSGVDLIRKREGKEVFAFSFPLITDASGKKFGKSEGNAVWLSGEKTTPYQFYQFWLNVEDEKVIDYLKIYTFISLEEIESIKNEHEASMGQRFAQKRLAAEVTSFVHGSENTEAASLVSGILFGDVGLSDLSDAEKSMLKQNAPTFAGAKGKDLVDVLVETNLASSKREAREFISSGAVIFSGEKIVDLNFVIDFTDIALLRRGKKNLVVLV